MCGDPNKSITGLCCCCFIVMDLFFLGFLQVIGVCGEISKVSGFFSLLLNKVWSLLLFSLKAICDVHIHCHVPPSCHNANIDVIYIF